MKYFLILLTSLIIFTGCSSKKYFEVDDTLGDYESNSASLNDNIKSFNKVGATLDNGEIITKKGVSNFQLPEGFEFINLSEDTVISTNYLNKILLNKTEHEFSTGVVAATLKDNILALVFMDNSIALYDINTKNILMKEYYSKSLANDTRIANPYYMGSLILFPTLDGKVIVVSAKSNKVIRTIVVDADSKFNNIIFLDVVNDTLIASSSNKVVSVGAGVVNLKEYNIRDIIAHNQDIFIATIDGQIIKTDISLNIQDRKKYKYAKFYALAYGSSLYALESQGYLINISNDFKSDKIYDFSFDNEENVIAIDNIIYHNDEYFIVK
ncbi:hypothetical protein [Malaciobacter marinus]|uniref:Uncharacterized protein n=1 Tax=Malaciobacter marinus TaxID=505249 RepID=A0A347THH8_9BACT|nr:MULTISPECIES: hypothetical protein [Malaciobacter]AXX86056.1 hypothetical protein AMRN_0286 [Malaciobacter marinus]PHO11366.1 hypothetical protein CPG38_13420 [Malaciobacter marinus]PHO14358.1 hypothetical protein CPH92_12445 [Malaciobacter marinus]RYA24024.1 hypothetical protein CRU96_04615 [Malaciobacter halophilus]